MLIARERGWHDLTMLRLLGHPRLPQVFPDFLIGIYHAMRTAGALMDAARLRSIALAPECPVAARLASYWALHVEEERGHDRWMLEDLQHLGIDTARALERPPAREVAEMMDTLHFWVLHTHPVA